MKIFISWSGNRSKSVAEALYRWLKDVIQFLDPWMSTENIEKGARWASDVAKILEDSKVGILCLTRENLTAPWLLFEAGALAKSLEDTFVCPYLVDLKPTELTEPLSHFQTSIANEEDTYKLLKTINKALGDRALSEEQLSRAFTKWWPELEKDLAKIPASQETSQPLRDDRELLEEVLSLARFLAKREPIQDIEISPEIVEFMLETLIKVHNALILGEPRATILEELSQFVPTMEYFVQNTNVPSFINSATKHISALSFSMSESLDNIIDQSEQ